MRIYVGNLPYQISEQELRQAFEAYGQVASVSIVSDKFTGSPKGFGFVEMPVRDQGAAAIQGLQGKEVGGRAIRVDEARPRPEGGGPQGFDRPRRPAGPGR